MHIIHDYFNNGPHHTPWMHWSVATNNIKINLFIFKSLLGHIPWSLFKKWQLFLDHILIRFYGIVKHPCYPGSPFWTIPSKLTYFFFLLGLEVICKQISRHIFIFPILEIHLVTVRLLIIIFFFKFISTVSLHFWF